MKSTPWQRTAIAMLLILSIAHFEGPWGVPTLIEAKLGPIGDAFVHQGMPGVNYGSYSYLWVQSRASANVRTFVVFDLARMPPGSYVTEAYLQSYISVAPSASRTLICQRVSERWAETGVTWDNQPPVDSTAAKSNETGIASGVPISWDVRDWVQAFTAGNAESYLPNYGWRIKDGTEETPTPYMTQFSSRESGDLAHGFILWIRYYPPHLQLEPFGAVFAGSWARMRVHRWDYQDKPITRGNLKVTLSSTSASSNKKFSLTEGGPPITELLIEEGVSFKDFWYYDDKPGTWMIKVSTTDYANYGDDSRPQTMMLDDKPPITDISVNQPKSQIGGILYVTKETTFSLAAADNASGVKETRYRIDGGAWLIFSRGDSFNIQAHDGLHTITYYSEDNIGNKEVEKSLSVFLDNTAPSILILEPNGTLARKSVSIEFRVIAKDNGSGIADVTLTLDGKTQGSMIKENDTYTKVVAVAAGVHEWRAECVDNVGNLAETSDTEFVLTIDVEPPMILNVFPSPDPPVMGEPIRISASVKDEVSGVNEVILHYSTDGGHTWKTAHMTPQAGLYGASIPAQGPGTKVQYLVEASDFFENTATSTTKEFIVGMPLWVYAIPLVAIPVLIIAVLILRGKIRKKLESTTGPFQLFSGSFG